MHALEEFSSTESAGVRYEVAGGHGTSTIETEMNLRQSNEVGYRTKEIAFGQTS
jgi:hypothetical protein